MWGMDWLDGEGSARNKQLLEQQEYTKSNQQEAPAPQPKVSTPGKQLPKNEQAKGGGALYSAATTPSGRVHTEQIVKKEESKGSPLADVARDVLEQKEYSVDPQSKSFVRAPSMARAYGIDKSEDNWGMNGYGGKIINGLATGIAPVIAGGLMGGRKGAMEAWQTAEKTRTEAAEQQQKQLADVSSDRVMREAYEMARMNYESDYNMGKTEMPFGDYLAQAMEAMSASGSSGTLQTFIDTWGPEEGYRRYAESKFRPRSGGGGGGGGGYETRYGIDPMTGETVRRKVPLSNTQLEGIEVVTNKDGTQTTKRQTGRPKASDF